MLEQPLLHLPLPWALLREPSDAEAPGEAEEGCEVFAGDGGPAGVDELEEALQLGEGHVPQVDDRRPVIRLGRQQGLRKRD